MTGLDTNVLVRYLTQDDPRQSAKANDLMRAAKRRGEKLFLNQIVLCELVWVLESVYSHPRKAIAEVIEKLLLTVQFEIESRDSVWAALNQYRENDADFADYLIGRSNLAQGCERTVTFDGALKGVPAFRLL